MTNREDLIASLIFMNDRELAEFLLYTASMLYCGDNMCENAEKMFYFCPECPKRPKIEEYANWLKKQKQENYGF